MKVSKSSTAKLARFLALTSETIAQGHEVVFVCCILK